MILRVQTLQINGKMPGRKKMSKGIKRGTGNLSTALKNQQTSNLYVGLAVCFFGALAVAGDLIVRQIPLTALLQSSAEIQQLVALSLVAFLLCVAGEVWIMAALLQKRKELAQQKGERK